ncbi:MAG: MBL fold metallo-hydrolase [Acetobacteraceae bacterium]|nr:MBL fold metallo-hydrolase [Acetobacteraceae bacterium]
MGLTVRQIHDVFVGEINGVHGLAHRGIHGGIHVREPLDADTGAAIEAAIKRVPEKRATATPASADGWPGTMRRLLLALLLLVPRLAWAGCAPISMNEPHVWLAGAADDAVTITFLGHASFEIETPAGVRAVTDYNGVNIPEGPPDIATMNHAHSTHYTLHPDPRIGIVLHGWRENGVVPNYDVVLRDMRVTNLPTNIRDGAGGTEEYGNSIFVFETAGLCIAHLSHLHHLLEPEDLAALGHIDVVMVAVDGAWTMSQADAAAVVEQIQPRVVLPMHYFTRDVLNRFIELERGRYDIDVRDTPTMTLSRTTLPARPTIVALPGGY